MATTKTFERAKEVVWYPSVSSDISYLQTQVQEIEKDCFDLRVPYENLSLHVTDGVPYLEFYDSVGYDYDLKLSPFALSQLCIQCGVPYDYMSKCLNYSDDWAHYLVSENLDYWLSQRTKKCVNSRTSKMALIRVYKDTIRGFLSDRFSKYDNILVAETLTEVLPEDDFKVVGSTINDEIFHARIVSRHELNIVGDDSPIFWGFYIDNSDVGRSTFSLKLMVWRQACKNGLVIPLVTGNHYIIKAFHKGDTSNYTELLAEAINSSELIVSRLVQMINSAVNKSISDNFEDGKAKAYFFDEVKARTGLSKKSVSEILEMLINGNYPKTQWGLINAITEYSQNYSLDRRISLETSAGKLLLAA